MKKNFLARVTKFVSWHRRGLAVLSAVCAVVALAMIASPPPEPTTAVVVAARTIAAGTKLGPDDLRLEHVPSRWVPPDAVTDWASTVGQVAVVGLSPPAVVTPSVLLGQRSAPPGRAMVPVRLADPGVLSLLRVGDTVDVVGVGVDGQNTVVASGARVVGLPAPGDSGPMDAGAPRGALVVLEVSAEQASAVSAAGGHLGVGLVLR